MSTYLAAYLEGYNTQHVLIKAIGYVKCSLDNGEHVVWILMDLSKTFDAFPHGLMIAKLRAYGISESACKFISSYLSFRQQRVKVGGDKGEWQYLKRGIPQGSVVGPLLFNIFQNDLFYFLVRLYNYADDNTLSKSDKDVKVLKQPLNGLKIIS